MTETLNERIEQLEKAYVSALEDGATRPGIGSSEMFAAGVMSRQAPTMMQVIRHQQEVIERHKWARIPDTKRVEWWEKVGLGHPYKTTEWRECIHCGVTKRFTVE